MSANEFYFCVGGPTGVHSAVWKVWVHGDELYATQVKGMAGLAKLSVHSSGICRYASLEGADIAWDTDTDPRVAKRWQIDKVGTTAWCACFTVVVPIVVLPQRFPVDRAASSKQIAQVVWVEPGPLFYARRVEFIRSTNPAADIREFVGDDEHQVLGSMRLRSGSKIWVVSRLQAPPEDGDGGWQNLVQTTVFDIVDGGDEFGTLFSPTDFTHPVIRDIALGPWNFRDGAHS